MSNILCTIHVRVRHCIALLTHVQSTFNTLVLDDGFVKRPTGPRLGIEVDEGYVRERSQDEVNWYNPVWHHDDGRLAEW
ncbi:hypothetical protein [Haloferax volcanii]|uniref:Galactonate dehydratase n=2 Tax=Haloferax volcanii TaxID=2246 RepID=M0HTX5_HALVO|nr:MULTISPECIES: hypothetical protein [Haloferax]ELZ75304.1 galactonate dehydratase [Haloferax lucentense DSM 14919]ELZ87946.1 galactonate dehydratase [Haloferax alexandrinus JCM 10717]